MATILNDNGKPVSKERQLDWDEADKHGLRPSAIRYIAGEPFAINKDGSGIYGPCPPRSYWHKAEDAVIAAQAAQAQACPNCGCPDCGGQHCADCRNDSQAT